MASRKFELEIDLKSKGAEKDLKKFNKTLDDTNKKTKENKKGNVTAKGGLAGFVGGLSVGTKVLGGIGIALTAATGAVLALNTALLSSATAIRELETMTKVADTTLATMQAMSIEAQKFGVSGEKMADIIQDVNDKLGDFTSTGAGPFKDFFEVAGKNVGLTAEALQGMPGPEKIIAIKDAIDSANISTEEQTFLLESLGSDLNRVIDIFGDGGAAIYETEKRLKALNAVITPAQSKAIKDYADEVKILELQWINLKDSILAEIAPAMKVLVVNAQEFVAWMQGTVSPNKTLEQLESDLIDVNKLLDETNKKSTVASVLGMGGVEIVNPAYTDAMKKREEIQNRIIELKKEEKDIDDAAAKRAEDAAKVKQKRIDAIATAQQGILTGLAEESKLISDQQAGLEYSNDAYRAILETQKQAGQLQKWVNQQIKDGVVVTEEMKEAYATLLSKRAGIAEEAKRLAGFRNAEKALKRELALLNANNDAERTRISLQQQVEDLNLDPDEAGALSALQAQIDARQKHLDMLEKEKEAVQSLAEAMGRWASGSKDAVKQVIAELIRLVAIRAFGGTGSFGGGFLTGFGSGGMNGYAEGGNFKSGETFMVGERGPEIITASAPGSVIPNHQLGGAGISITPQLVINGGVNGVDELSSMFSDFSNEIASQTQHLIKTQLGPRGVFA